MTPEEWKILEKFKEAHDCDAYCEGCERLEGVLRSQEGSWEPPGEFEGMEHVLGKSGAMRELAAKLGLTILERRPPSMQEIWDDLTMPKKPTKDTDQ